MIFRYNFPCSYVLDCCLIVDCGLGGHVVDVVATAYQKAVLTIVEFFHAPNGAGAVEIGELPDIEPSALRYFHSFYSHRPLMFERLS